MPPHETAFLPIHTWTYSSPDQARQGRTIDIGLLAEALLYYEQVVIEMTDGPDLPEFVSWFDQQDRLVDLLAMLEDRTITFYGYDYMLKPLKITGGGVSTHAVTKFLTAGEKGNECWAFMNAFADGFAKQFNYEYFVDRFRTLLPERFIVSKSSEFDSGLDNARHDFDDARRCGIIFQAFVDKLYKMRSLGRPPEIKVDIGPIIGQQAIDLGRHGPLRARSININLDLIKSECGSNLQFDWGVALAAGASCNRTIESARKLKADMFLGEPMSVLVGDKLYEVTREIEMQANLQQLKERVAFPNVRALVNEGVIDLGHILEWRKKAKRFREWLQTESELDRDAILAYHNEFGRQTGYQAGLKKMLKLFKVAIGGAAGAWIGQVVDQAGLTPMGTPTPLLGAGLGAATSYLVETAAALPAWKPVVFGDWLDRRIRSLLEEQQRRPQTIITPVGDIATKLTESESEKSAQQLHSENQ